MHLKWLVAILIVMVVGAQVYVVVAREFECASVEEWAGKLPVDVAELFERYGWSATGPAEEVSVTMPEEFFDPETASGRFPWEQFVELSRDVGLDFTRYSGEDLIQLWFRVADCEKNRLAHVQGDLQGVVLLHPTEGVVGAWLRDYRPNTDGVSGWSLKARSLEEVTGKSFRDWMDDWSKPE